MEIKSVRNLLAKLLRIKPEKEYVYVPDYRGRILFLRMLANADGGYTHFDSEKGISTTLVNNTGSTVEVVVYKYVNKKK